MRFVIIGAGRVGLRTARVLRDEDHEVTLVERDEPTIRRARDQGFSVVEGDGSRETVLEEAGVASADAVGALSGDLNVNFTACMIANHYGCRTVMRIDEAYREEIYRKYADQVNEVIYPERLGAIGAKNALLGGTIRAIADVAPHLQVVELTITDAAPVNGYTISELQLPADATVLAFGKDGRTLEIPTEDLSIEDGDRLVVLADFDVLSDVRQLLVGESADQAAANAGTGGAGTGSGPGSAATELTLEADAGSDAASPSNSDSDTDSSTDSDSNSNSNSDSGGVN
ncbi:potassium channel family protein [Natrinema salifodinae]|uniref:Trk system potassium uptake protein TrkA n=1 Tax=Natrinema salifodinae TaxID=1202768 RepID=A0A1I0NN40_9EURY|nr:TrkA family potassium uptake protein [Natrinema salifodinae]SEW02681.1 trk system potassium uptake protein TrkA [Natrinema salifodinae]